MAEFDLEKWKKTLKEMFFLDAERIKKTFETIDTKKFDENIKALFDNLLNNFQKIYNKTMVENIPLLNQAVMAYYMFGVVIGSKLGSEDFIPILLNKLQENKQLQETISNLQKLIQQKDLKDPKHYI